MCPHAHCCFKYSANLSLGLASASASLSSSAAASLCLTPPFRLFFAGLSIAHFYSRCLFGLNLLEKSFDWTTFFKINENGCDHGNHIHGFGLILQCHIHRILSHLPIQAKSQVLKLTCSSHILLSHSNNSQTFLLQLHIQTILSTITLQFFLPKVIQQCCRSVHANIEHPRSLKLQLARWQSHPGSTCIFSCPQADIFCRVGKSRRQVQKTDLRHGGHFQNL